MLCTSCGEDAVLEMTEQAQTVCTRCGTVLSENAIVSDIQFGETGSGAAMVQGSYVSHDQSGFLRRGRSDEWEALTSCLTGPPLDSSRSRSGWLPSTRHRDAGIARTNSRKRCVS